MRVAILNLTGGGLSGGYKKYLESLVPRLRKHAAVSDLFIGVPPNHESLRGLEGVSEPWSSGEQWRGFPMLRRTVQAWKPDVVFIPTARYLNCEAPCVSMVRNMEPMLPFNRGDGIVAFAKHRLGFRLARHAAQRSSRVIAVSDFVRDYLVEQWHLPTQKIGTVYHGVDVASAVNDTPATLRSLAASPFVFVAGSLLPYRGIEDAIEALPLVADPNIRLAIAGDGSTTYRNRMHELARQKGVSDRVVWLGHLSNVEMAWAYQQCLAFLMTSRVEACPNTVLEALSNGALSVATKCAPMPEFFGDTAEYYGVGNAAALAARVNEVTSLAPNIAIERRRAARLRAEDFSWDRTAELTVEQLRMAVGSP